MQKDLSLAANSIDERLRLLAARVHTHPFASAPTVAVERVRPSSGIAPACS